MNQRFGMSIDIDRCNGCGACMVACAAENNMAPAHEGANDRKGITWIRVFRVDNGEEYPDRRPAFVPVLCQQCGEHTPCASVCPQQQARRVCRTSIPPRHARREPTLRWPSLPSPSGSARWSESPMFFASSPSTWRRAVLVFW